MFAKDYYKVLEVSHTAGQTDIKKAYRQLAMRYHPDKNDNNPLATDHFKEIREAYHVLSDPNRRSAYNQQCWYHHIPIKESSGGPVTAISLLAKSKKLTRYVVTLDPSRINEESLFQYISQLLSNHTVSALINLNDSSTNLLLVIELLKAMRPLSFKYIDQLAVPLLRLAGDDKHTVEVIQKYLKEKKLYGYWQRYQSVMILLIAILICCIIYIISN